MTPRERAEALWNALYALADDPSFHDKAMALMETAITEHVRELLGDEATIEVMAKAIHADIMENATRDHPAMRPLLWDEMGLKNRDDYRKTARAALAALRRKALGE